VVSLDAPTSEWLASRGFPCYEKQLVSRSGSTDNHATSGLKFKVGGGGGSRVGLG
jgi:hypothetical protein